MTSYSRDSMIRYGLLVILVGMTGLLALLEPSFLRVGNVFIILQSVSIVALLALGVTTSMVVGGFDLSIGSVAAASLMAPACAMVVWKLGTVEAILFCLAIGLATGAINAFLIVRLRIPDLLATLGMMFLIVGLQLIPTGGRSIASGMQLPSSAIADGSFAAPFLMLGRYRIADVVPVLVVVVAVLAVVTRVFLERTRWGRMMYAIGGNEQAARLAGAPKPFDKGGLRIALDGKAFAAGHVHVAGIAPLDRRDGPGRSSKPPMPGSRRWRAGARWTIRSRMRSRTRRPPSCVPIRISRWYSRRTTSSPRA